MDISSLLLTRVANQQLLESDFKTPHDLVSWMGAVQAQDYNMGKWAVGVRLSGITDKDVEEAANKGEIIRTHILRPTWHFVAREDIHWMLQLSAPRLRPILYSAEKELKLREDIVSKSNMLVLEILENEPDLTRQEIGERLEQKGLSLDSIRINYIMFRAEIEGLVCNGVVRGKKQTYDLLERKAPRKNEFFDKDEALEKLARKYFNSHGPATLQDFIWWSGLTGTEAKRAVEILKPDYSFCTLNEQVYIFNESLGFKHPEKDVIHLLPAFDELFVSYKDRKEILDYEHQKKVIVSNGVFKPTVFLNGKIIGIWNRVVKTKGIISEITCFKNPSKKVHSLMEKASKEYGVFANNQ